MAVTLHTLVRGPVTTVLRSCRLRCRATRRADGQAGVTGVVSPRGAGTPNNDRPACPAWALSWVDGGVADGHGETDRRTVEQHGAVSAVFTAMGHLLQEGSASDAQRAAVLLTRYPHGFAWDTHLIPDERRRP